MAATYRGSWPADNGVGQRVEIVPFSSALRRAKSAQRDVVLTIALVAAVKRSRTRGQLIVLST
jgi:hypothetical protein